MCCFKLSKKEALEKMVIDKGSEILEEDFNYKTLIERARKSNFESRSHDMKNIVNYNEYD